MWFSVYEVAKARCLDPAKFTEFATGHMDRYGVELHAWGEIVVDVCEADALVAAFQTRFPEYSGMAPEGVDDPGCAWKPLDFFRVDRQGERVWSHGNPKWKEEPPVVKRRLP